MTLTIRPAGPGDAATVHGFILKLADYEKLRHEVTATEADTAAALFGPSPRVFCDLAELEGQPVGFALWFHTFSTFQGRHGIWLEDLFVEPGARGHGIGKALLSRLARRCVDEGLGRLEWWVLDWNRPSIEFYKAQGAQMQDEWTVCRVDGAALDTLAGRGPVGIPPWRPARQRAAADRCPGRFAAVPGKGESSADPGGKGGQADPAPDTP